MGLPSTLGAWRDCARAFKAGCRDPYELWAPRWQFFRDNGYTLWVPTGVGTETGYRLVPPNKDERNPDGYSYLSRYEHGSPKLVHSFQQVNPLLCPARTKQNVDVLVRLISIRGDASGDMHLKILRRIARGHMAALGRNHALPVLDELYEEDAGLIFVVVPLVTPVITVPDFYTLLEGVDYIEQILEGVEFCHQHRVAHLDLDKDNILINFMGGPIAPEPTLDLRPFRSHFPVRYYLNDFELGVCFDEDSAPDSRTVTGYPTAVAGRTGDYNRDVPPEMRLDQPYCPFRTDVWHLGIMFQREFATFDDFAEFHQLFQDMLSDEPRSRPTAAEALERVRNLKSKIARGPEDAEL